MAGTKKKNRRSARLTGGLLLLVLTLAAAVGWNVYTLIAPSRAPEQAQERFREPEEQKPVEILDRSEPVKPADPRPAPRTETEETIIKMPELPEKPEAEPLAEEPPAYQVPETDMVEDTYFANAVFLGNSRTEGFKLYSGLKQGTFVYGTGATVDTIFKKSTWVVDGTAMPMLDAVKTMGPDQIYTMFGTNELGWVRPDLFKEHYGKVIDRLQEDHPEAQIILQSILPVTKTQEEKHSYVNNERITLFNGLIRELAEEQGCWYLDVQAAVVDEDGFLREDCSYDGVHLNRTGCAHWHDYLKTHAV